MDHYFELAKTLFCDVNPIPVKDAVNRIGYAAGPLCRMPLVPFERGQSAEDAGNAGKVWPDQIKSTGSSKL